MADQYSRIGGHLHSTELADMRESLSELSGTILWRMVTQDASKDQEFKLISFGRLKDFGRSHVHEANVT